MKTCLIACLMLAGCAAAPTPIPANNTAPDIAYEPPVPADANPDAPELEKSEDFNPTSLVQTRIPPQYPTRALAEGLEGECVITFDITVSGQPYNYRDIRCSSELFRTNSLKALSKWSFYPSVQNGVPVEVRGVAQPIRFRLAN